MFKRQNLIVNETYTVQEVQKNYLRDKSRWAKTDDQKTFMVEVNSDQTVIEVNQPLC